ncbi:MAG: hypothetical protein K2L87_00805 [Clostridiales bacterium]|nr:hypothetical protein [Clostridiales bacterium]
MKKRDDSIQKINFSDDFLIDSAERRFQDGDYLGALSLLNKREERGLPNADAFALMADIYEALELYHMAADSWYRFLDTCNEADFGEGYEGLAVAFMNMGEDFEAAMFYRKMFAADGTAPEEIPDFEEASAKPRLRVLPSGEEEYEEYLTAGELALKETDFDKAYASFKKVPEDSKHYATAGGYAALCTLLNGEEAQAQRECEEILKSHPENVQTLITYCAALGAEKKRDEARAVAEQLAKIETDDPDELYRIATALCETELNEDAYRVLSKLKNGKYCYDETVLYFHAVAAYKTGNIEDAIDSLTRRCTLYPRGAVAQYFLQRLRKLRDGIDEPFEMSYIYNLPAEDFNKKVSVILKIFAAEGEEAEKYCDLPNIEEYFRLALDLMDGRDSKLLTIAVRAAVKCRCDSFVREMLLDYEGNLLAKFIAMGDLAARNEENTFGVVIFNAYKEYHTHTLDIGTRKQKQFLDAFGEVYSRFSTLGEAECEDKMVLAAEDVYSVLERARAWDLMDEREALAAAIYREARLPHGARGMNEIAGLFGADVNTMRAILDFLI